MKYIKRKSAVRPITGSIVDTRNVTDKTSNALSIAQLDRENTYSTEETFTGQYWIDGKPIYRKVFNFGALPATTTEKTIQTGLLNTNVNVIRFYGYSTDIAKTQVVTLPRSSHVSASAIALNLWSENSASEYKLGITAGGDRSNLTETYITVEYTKTTD